MLLNSKPVVIEDNTKNTSLIVLIFPSKIELDEDVIKFNILRQILVSCNNKLREFVQWKKQKDSLYLIGYNCNFKIIGKNLYFQFFLEVPKEGLMDDFNIDECFQFFMDNIFDPYVEDNQFGTKKFQDELNFAISNLEQSIHGFEKENYQKFMNIIDKDNHLGSNYEISKKKLEELTNEKLYQEYLNRIKNNDFLVYAFGSITEEEIERLFTKYHKYSYKNITINNEFFDIFKENDFNYTLDKCSYQQSALYLQFQVEDFEPKDLNYLNLLTNILNVGENNLLFKTLRIDHGLVYGVHLNKFLYNGFFVEEMYLSKKNKDQAIELVEDTLKHLVEDKKFLKNCVDKLITGCEVEIIENSDGDFYDFYNLIYRDLGQSYLSKIVDEYKKFKLNDIIRFIKRVKVTNILFIEGEEND